MAVERKKVIEAKTKISTGLAQAVIRWLLLEMIGEYIKKAGIQTQML